MGRALGHPGCGRRSLPEDSGRCSRLWPICPWRPGPETVLERSVRGSGTRELSGRARPRLAGVSGALCLLAALILQTAHRRRRPLSLGQAHSWQAGPNVFNKMLPGGVGGWEKKKKKDRRKFSLQKLIYFQRLSVAPCKSDPKYPFRKK